MNGYQGSPTLARLIMGMIEQRLLECWAPFPGRVVSYDAATQTATIRPGIKIPTQQDEAGSYPSELEIPDLDEVPVRMPLAGGGWRIATSLQAGDLVMVHVTFREFESWIAGNGDAVTVLPGRHHDINDCWAEPWDHGVATTDSLVIEGHGARIELTSAGVIKIDGATVQINGNGPAAARVGDAVSCGTLTITAPPTIVGTYVNALGVTTPFVANTPIPLIGKVVSGSTTVGIGG